MPYSGIAVQGTVIPHTPWHSQKVKEKNDYKVGLAHEKIAKNYLLKYTYNLGS